MILAALSLLLRKHAAICAVKRQAANISPLQRKLAG